MASWGVEKRLVHHAALQFALVDLMQSSEMVPSLHPIGRDSTASPEHEHAPTADQPRP